MDYFSFFNYIIYTTYTCQTCGYSYNDNYTLKKHQVSQYNIIKEADYERARAEIEKEM